VLSLAKRVLALKARGLEFDSQDSQKMLGVPVSACEKEKKEKGNGNGKEKGMKKGKQCPKNSI